MVVMLEKDIIELEKGMSVCCVCKDCVNHKKTRHRHGYYLSCRYSIYEMKEKGIYVGYDERCLGYEMKFVTVW
jgi:hypothetical protein